MNINIIYSSFIHSFIILGRLEYNNGVRRYVTVPQVRYPLLSIESVESVPQIYYISIN